MGDRPGPLELQGHLVPVAEANPDAHFVGRVGFGATPAGGSAVGRVAHRRGSAPTGVTQVDVGDSYIYPGLTDLHSHLGFATLPMWAEPNRTDQPWLHRDQWPNAPSYKPDISWPAYAYLKGAPEALLAYAQVRALAGGTTSIQGWPPARGSPVNHLVRSVDDDMNRDVIRTSVINLRPDELASRKVMLDDGRTLVYHLSEGQLHSAVAKEFGDAAVAGCLREGLVAIHCCAVGAEEFRQWRMHSELAGEPHPGGVVWSPLSNLWLYGQTTDVVAAAAEGLTVCLGTDWGPSGTRNLLGEMKVALRWVVHQGLDLDAFDMARMVTSSPGDLLQRAWGRGPGRLGEGRLADAVVIARRHDDPWKNLVLARESDVELVVSDGRAVYGDRALLAAAGARQTTPVRITGGSKHALLRDPLRPERRWAWTKVVAQLKRVQADPLKAIEDGLSAEANYFAAPDLHSLPPLILESDMPGGLASVAGPPPAGQSFEVPELPPIAHDAAWHRSLRGRGFHQHLLDHLDDLFADDATWPGAETPP